jgi:DNA-binding MarR family transcriptional regulator
VAKVNPNPAEDADLASDDLAHQALMKMRIVIGALRQHFHAVEKACGISGAQVWMLSVIETSPGITVTRLSEALSVHVSTASTLLDKLDKAGLVERLRSASDRRVVELWPTAQGRKVLERAPQPLSEPVPHALERLPRSALTRLNQDLAALIREMRDVDADAAHTPLSALVR